MTEHQCIKRNITIEEYYTPNVPQGAPATDSTLYSPQAETIPDDTYMYVLKKYIA
jgi:hypothetical protein